MVQERLKDEKKIAELLQPMNVLDSLVNAHMLVRSGIEAGGVSFQHQQFQEWFASFRVQQLMLSTSQGDSDANKILRRNILDIPVWEEAVLFACNRLSRADKDGINSVAQAILETLGIDPLLSAEMIQRSSDEVWDQVRDDVVSFARKWHTPGRVDRAAKFMIYTGRVEFSEFVRPLVSDADDQVHLRALRAGRRFRPGVLGPDAEERIAALPEVSARIQEEADKLIVEGTDPGRIRIDFSDEDQNNWLVIRAYELYPEEVVAWLLALLEQGKKVPFQAEEMLRMSTVVIDDGPLADCVLKHTGDGRDAAIAASVVGPKTVGNLIDQMLAVYARIKANDRYDESLRNEYHKLMDLISGSKVDPFAEAVLERSNTEDPHQVYVLAELISRHGGSVERERLRLAPETQERITTAVQRWTEILFTFSEATRAQFAEIAQAAERLESPELVPVLLKLLPEDLKRKKRAQEEWLEARKQERQIQNDANMSWTLQYQRAFAAIGDQQTIDAMRTYLLDPEFGFEAAHVLKAVWRESQAPQDESGFLKSWPDFSAVPDAYRNRQSGTGEETHPFVGDIIAAISELIKPGAGENNFIHALKLATVAFSMPYTDKMETVNALLQLPVPAAGKRDLLTVLVLSGEPISSEIVLSGVDDLLEEAKSKPWMLQEQDGWRLKDWLQLLPFTDRPAAVLEVLERAEDFRADPWKLSSLLSALSYAPSVEAEKVLDELAKRDERFLSEHDWTAALTNRNTLSAARLLLDFICNASFTERRGWRDHSDLGRKVAKLMASDDQFRQDIYERFPALDDGPARSVLEYAIAEAADAEGVLLLTRQGAAKNKRFRSTEIHMALCNILIATELRKGLFDLVVNGSTEEARLATECLCAIDEIRDDYGHFDSEPRHPDISAGVP